MADQMALITFTNRLSGLYAAEEIKDLVKDYRYLNHPYVYQAAGQACLAYKHYGDAIPLFESAIKCGLIVPDGSPDGLFFDPVGSSISKILTQYRYSQDSDIIDKLIKLGYCYLSTAIELSQVAFESLSSRAELATLHAFHTSIVPAGHLREVLAISDYVNAAQQFEDSGYRQEGQEKRSYALKIHNDLEDISILGKDADEYNIREVAKIGDERHTVYFNQLRNEFINNSFQLSNEEFEKFIETVSPK
jgi:hypothetical protein